MIPLSFNNSSLRRYLNIRVILVRNCILFERKKKRHGASSKSESSCQISGLYIWDGGRPVFSISSEKRYLDPLQMSGSEKREAL